MSDVELRLLIAAMEWILKMLVLACLGYCTGALWRIEKKLNDKDKL
jgi:hypothetical protein